MSFRLRVGLAWVLAIMLILSGCQKPSPPEQDSTPTTTAAATTGTTNSPDPGPPAPFTDQQKAATVLTIAKGNKTVNINGDRYLAYLYSLFYQAVRQQGAAISWEKEYPYNGQPLKLEPYLHNLAQDALIRHTAVQLLLEQYGLAIPESEMKELREQLASVSDAQLAVAGCSRQSYEGMQIAYQLSEKTLFFGLYGEGGPFEVPLEELASFFSQNIFQYKEIQVLLTGKSALDRELLLGDLETYKQYYQQEKNFDKLIAYHLSQKGKWEDFAYTPTGTDYVNTLQLNNTKETELARILPTLSFDEPKVVTYTNATGQEVGALLLRIDPTGGKPLKDYVAENREMVLTYAKMADYVKWLNEYIQTLKVTRHQEAIDALSPQVYTPPLNAFPFG